MTHTPMSPPPGAPCHGKQWFSLTQCPRNDARCLGCTNRLGMSEEEREVHEMLRADRIAGSGRLAYQDVRKLVAWWAECEGREGGLVLVPSAEDPTEPDFLHIRCQIGVTMAHVDRQMGITPDTPPPKTWCTLVRTTLVKVRAIEPVGWFLRQQSTRYHPLAGKAALLVVLDAWLQRYVATKIDQQAELVRQRTELLMRITQRKGIATWLERRTSNRDLARLDRAIKSVEAHIESVNGVRDEVAKTETSIVRSAAYCDALDRLRYAFAPVVDQWPRLEAIVGGRDKSSPVVQPLATTGLDTPHS